MNKYSNCNVSLMKLLDYQCNFVRVSVYNLRNFATTLEASTYVFTTQIYLFLYFSLAISNVLLLLVTEWISIVSFH